MNQSVSNRYFSLSLEDPKNYLVLFLLWPFLAFLTALANYNKKESRKIVYAFLVYYGLSYVMRSDGYVDSVGYIIKLKINAALPFSDFFKIVGGLYSDTTVDIIEPLVSFIISRFTSHHGVFFGVWAAIFGFFYLKSINHLVDLKNGKLGWNALIMLGFFIMILPITTINGVRMPTATWIFIYGAIHVVLYRDPRYLILTMGASLVHWSFITANVVLFIYYFAGNRNIVYIPLVILSFILPQIIAPVFRSISLRLGGALQNRYDGYSNEGYNLGIQESYEDASWFMGLSDDMVFYFLIITIIIIRLKYGSILKEKLESNLFSFSMLFLSFVNFGKNIPTFGGRFQQIFYLFAAAYLYICFLKIPVRKISYLILAGLFPMLLYSAIMFRVGSESISSWMFTPGLGIPLLAPALSLFEVLFS